MNNSLKPKACCRYCNCGRDITIPPSAGDQDYEKLATRVGELVCCSMNERRYNQTPEEGFIGIFRPYKVVPRKEGVGEIISNYYGGKYVGA